MSPGAPRSASARALASEGVRVLERVSDVLEESLAQAEDLRGLLVTLDADAVLEAAVRRRRLNEALAEAHRALAGFLHQAGGAVHLEVPSLTALAEALDGEAGELKERVAKVRRLAADLGERDRVNRALGERALAVLGGYLSALRPPSPTYDRRGRASEVAAPAGSTTRTA